MSRAYRAFAERDGVWRMIPSLVAPQLQESIVEYLATTFALSEDEAYRALTEFLQRRASGDLPRALSPCSASLR